MTQTLSEILAAPLDPNRREASSYPWWFILDPKALTARAMSAQQVINAIGMSAVTGPFFSRESAAEYLAATRYNFGKDAIVWCASGCFSKGYADLLGLARHSAQVAKFLERKDWIINRILDGEPVQRPNATAEFNVESNPPAMPHLGATFSAYFKMIQAQVHDNAVDKGWWEEDHNEAELIALEHAELSEALEAMRHGNPPSEHIPEFSGVEEELADVIIRIMDHAAAKGHRVADAVVAKMAFNTTRPHRHGGKAF